MLTVEDVARHWRLRPAAVRQRIAAGDLEAVLIAGRFRMDWPSVWACEGGQPPPVRTDAYKVALMTKRDLAERVGVSTRTIERWVTEGLPMRSVGANRRFNRSEAAAWLRTRFGRKVADLLRA